MVPRYARPEMTAIWSPENRFRIWFEIEAHATDALAELGTVPKSAAKALWDWWATHPKIDVEAIDAIESEGTLPDVLTYNPAKPARYPNGRALTDDVADFRSKFLTNGKKGLPGFHTPSGLLSEFPYLAPPR